MVEKPLQGKPVLPSVFRGGSVKFYLANEAENTLRVNLQAAFHPSTAPV
jgi:hypothetical protein